MNWDIAMVHVCCSSRLAPHMEKVIFKIRLTEETSKEEDRE